MSELFSVYSYIVKTAAQGEVRRLVNRVGNAASRLADDASVIATPITVPADYVLNTSGIGRGVGKVYSRAAHGLASIRDYIYGAFDPFATPVDRHSSLTYNLGHEVGDFFLPKVYEPEDLGPYEEYSRYLKETETGDLLLREAAKLRRRARLLKKLRKQEEKEKEYASRSRYF